MIVLFSCFLYIFSWNTNSHRLIIAKLYRKEFLNLKNSMLWSKSKNLKSDRNTSQVITHYYLWVTLFIVKETNLYYSDSARVQLYTTTIQYLGNPQ